jgi:hypothetical protein
MRISYVILCIFFWININSCNVNKRNEVNKISTFFNKEQIAFDTMKKISDRLFVDTINAITLNTRFLNEIKDINVTINKKDTLINILKLSSSNIEKYKLIYKLTQLMIKNNIVIITTQDSLNYFRLNNIYRTIRYDYFILFNKQQIPLFQGYDTISQIGIEDEIIWGCKLKRDWFFVAEKVSL